MMNTPMPRVRPSTAVVWSPSPSRMPTCPVPSANSVGSDIQLRTTFAVPSVKSQPKPSPLAQPITAITATETAVSDPPAMTKALNVPPQRHASAIATNPTASRDGSLTCEDIVISTTPSDQHRHRSPSGPVVARLRPRQRSRQQRAVGVYAAQGELRAGEHQPEHQRLVVDARHQMHDQQRVGRAQPQRADLGDAAAARQPRHRPHDEADAEQHHEPVAAAPRTTMFSPVSAEMPLAEPQEQRTVGRRRLAPHGRHRQGEHVVEAEPGARGRPCTGRGR